MFFIGMYQPVIKDSLTGQFQAFGIVKAHGPCVSMEDAQAQLKRLWVETHPDKAHLADDKDNVTQGSCMINDKASSLDDMKSLLEKHFSPLQIADMYKDIVDLTPKEGVVCDKSSIAG